MVTRILVVIASLAVIGLIVGAVVLLRGNAAAPGSSPTPTVKAAAASTGGLVSTDTVVGTGAEAVAGKKVTVNYTGTLDDGTKFDSSLDRNQPFDFTLGTGQVIKGWDDGVVGMKVGGKRTLVIPASLGYGASANGAIPANSTLHFDIELLNVQ